MRFTYRMRTRVLIMAVTRAQVSLVVIQAVDTFVVLAGLACGADHTPSQKLDEFELLPAHRPYYSIKIEYWAAFLHTLS